ncbi:hypothetical protein [Microbulbifer taiwanensis]|uniref:Uncharacterized protein n=1 Tax=Microbulbifer taiwanensis TaxID=986746 RepID=A0ABW1YMC5_9GAMM|nr:hypothetical protein [Microbulbifer taiwanensis]
MPNRERGGVDAPLVEVTGAAAKRDRQSLPLEQRERLAEADKLAALIQFTLTGRDVTELNHEVQAGCSLVLDQIRDAVQGVVSQ